MANLTVEYEQWKFSKRTLKRFMELLGLNGRRQTGALREAVNVYHRWILSLHQSVNVLMDKTLPLFPRLELHHPTNMSLISGLVEKKLVHDGDGAFHLVRQLWDFIEDFRRIALLQQQQQQSCSVVSDKATTTVATWTEPAVNVVDDGSIALLIVGEYQSPKSVRIKYLVDNFGRQTTACMVLRYESAGVGSYQWGDPISVHRMYYVDFNARHEGFSSPLNSRFLGQTAAHFCSVFYDCDHCFGSLGNFFQVTLSDYPGGWTVNPPFIESVLERAARKVLLTLDKKNPCYFFMNYPYWTDSVGWLLLDHSPHKTARFDFEPGEFIVQDTYGATLRPNMKLSIFVVGELPANAPPVERVKEVVCKPRKIAENCN